MARAFTPNQLIGILIILALLLPYIPFLNALEPLAKVVLFIAALWLLFK